MPALDSEPTLLHDPETCWRAVAERRTDTAPFVYAVTTTGIYCRPGCASRLPNRANVRFFAAPTDAERAGFRPCRRCEPDREAPLDALVRRATALIDTAETPPPLAALASALDVGEKRLVRAFKERLGITPKAFAQARRRGRLQHALGAEARVTDAIYAAGYAASSRFYSEAEAVLGMTPGRFRAKGAGLRLRYATAACPLGRLLVAATEKGVAMIAFGDDDASLEADFATRFAAAERLHDSAGLEPLLTRLVAAIDEPAGAAAIPLDLRGTAFQQRVWAALRAIPPGETRTYGEVASSIGAPRAVRAVAGACAGNPTALAVPCHRVLPKDGGIGGYRWGAARKKRLLARERRAFDQACQPRGTERSCRPTRQSGGSMAEDRRGLAYSSENDEAVGLFDRAVDHYLEYRLDTGDLLGQAMAADPGFVMPRIVKASMLRLLGSNSVQTQIEAELAAIDAAGTPLNPREALHLEALKQWVAGDVGTARRAWDAIVQEWPFDLVALRHMHFQSFWLGEQQSMRDSVASALPAWTDDMPGYGFMLGMFAFGLEEMGDYGRAEAIGREAVERNPDDLWAIHAVAHVLEMQGRLQDGIAWLDYPDDHWADRGPVKNHVWWHAGLFAVESGDFDAALAVYDTHVKPGERRISTDMMNAPSLLARLELAGGDVGDRWEHLGEWSTGWVDDHVIAFTDAHTMIPLARTERHRQAEAFIASLERFAKEKNNDAARRIEPLILPLAKGIRALYAGKPGETVELLTPIRHALLPIGGSWAQRDIFHQLLLEAAIQAGNWPLARSMASERIALRPENHLEWLKFGEMFDAAGDPEAAERVREIADQHRP